MNLFSIYLRGSRTRKAGSVKVRPINQISALIGPLSLSLSLSTTMDERVSGRRREEEKQTSDAQKIREYGNKSINGKCGTTSIKGVVFPESREFRLGCSAAQEDDVRGRKGEPKWRPDSLDHYFMWCIYNEGRGGGGERLKPIPFRLFWSRRLDCIWMERLAAKIYIMKAGLAGRTLSLFVYWYRGLVSGRRAGTGEADAAHKVCPAVSVCRLTHRCASATAADDGPPQRN